jgi:hypothetical protein
MKFGLALTAFSLSLLLAPVSYAQSSGDAPPDDTIETTTDAVSVPATMPVPAAVYLRTADSMPFGLWEVRLSDTLRNYRLGVFTVVDTQKELRLLDGAAKFVAARLEELTPPPQFADVHQLNIEATTEYGAAFQSIIDALNTDDHNFTAAISHLQRAEAAADLARQELR